VISTLLPESHPIVFDVGANEGQTIKRVSRIFRNPKIYAFEPIPELVKKLQIDYSDDVISGNLIVINAACGNVNSQSDFYVNAVSGHSSLLSLNPNSEWLKRRSGEKHLNTWDTLRSSSKSKLSLSMTLLTWKR
jgi:FkbM family methyltransferase